MKTMIAYFSWSNNTKRIVEEVNKKFNYPVYRIERKKPYSSDYEKVAYHEAKDEVDQRIHPEIKELPNDISSYDRILLFFPIWWYTFPMPIATFIERLKDYKGEIVVFANSYTNDYTYMKNSLRDLKKINSNIKYVEGLFNKNVNQHINYIENLK